MTSPFLRTFSFIPLLSFLNSRFSDPVISDLSILRISSTLLFIRLTSSADNLFSVATGATDFVSALLANVDVETIEKIIKNAIKIAFFILLFFILIYGLKVEDNES